MDQILIPAVQIPTWRTKVAVDTGVADNLLFTTWGGIGDQICAEPTLRFACDTFKKSCKVSLWTEHPYFFEHLPFDHIYDGKDQPDLSKYFVMQTIVAPDNLTWEFISHCVSHCVDFPSVCALRCTLPISYKAVRLPVTVSHLFALSHRHLLFNDKFVAIHAGKHWQSKTFPKEWWDRLLDLLIIAGKTPVLFGKEIDENQGTVDVNTSGCIDLRNSLSLSQSVWLLQRMHALLCSDSSPMHMAVSGQAHIGFVATAKHQDYLYHWRYNDRSEVQWAWRMKHFNKGGIWDLVDNCPNKKETVTVDKCTEDDLKSWLPDPEEMVEWVVTREKVHDRV